MYPILSRISCTLRCNWSYFNDFLNPKSCVLRLNYFEIFAKIRSLRKSGDATVVILKSNQVHVVLHQWYKFQGPTPAQLFAIVSESRFWGARILPKISKFPTSETHLGRFRKIEWSNGPEIWTIDREHHQLDLIWVWTRSYHQIFPQNGPNTRKTRLLIKTAKNGHFEGHSRADCENISDSMALRFGPFTKDKKGTSDFGDNRDPVTGHFGRRPKAPLIADCKPLRRKLDEGPTLLYYCPRRGL